MKKIFGLFLLVSLTTQRLLQFSKHVPGKLQENPNPIEYGEGEFQNPLDPYIPPPREERIRRFFSMEDNTFPTQNVRKTAATGLSQIFRTYDGNSNNLANPEYGAKDAILERRANANYKDGYGVPDDSLPNPRTLSNRIAKVKNVTEFDPNNVTALTVFFGQFVDHDLDLTQFGHTERFDIPIPPNDKWFSGQFIQFFRSPFDNGPNNRQFRNLITSWIDGSQIYGSDEETARFLRSFSNGKLRTSRNNMLPVNDQGFYVAGDIRANENLVLLAFHTIFMREHNRFCDELRAADPTLNDEELYQAARNFVIGLLQKIYVYDFLRILLGSKFSSIIPQYSGYKDQINPTIPIEFSTAAFRVGHALMTDYHPLINGQGVKYSEPILQKLFFNPRIFKTTPNALDDLLRGQFLSLAKFKNTRVSRNLRNLLESSPTDQEKQLDLFALNIQRSRDHGLPSYNDVREQYGLPRLTTFNSLVQPGQEEIASQLQSLYGDINKVQLWIGIIAERSVRNGILGELGCEIVGQTFRNLRDGDRFWFENGYPQGTKTRILRTSLSDIIKRTTEFKDIGPNAFKRS